MIKIATRQSGLVEHTSEMRQMFRARAEIFHNRLGWNVEVNTDGLEIDRYDEREDPVYVLACEGEQVRGSLRLLPTTGETMLRNDFAAMFDEPVDFQSPTAWECTRFCVHPRAQGASAASFQATSGELLIGLCGLAMRSGIDQIIGLYDDRMTRIYKRIGWSPAPLARTGFDGQHLIVGIWDVTEAALEGMMSKLAATNRDHRAA